MRLPFRKSQALRQVAGSENDYLTAAAIERLKKDLHNLEKSERPMAVEDLSVALAKGDLSENAEYQDAKSRLSRIDGRIFSIKDRLKRVIVIDESVSSTGRIHIGSTVVLEPGPGVKRTYQIVGPRETNPTRGRISHLSPLGAALLNHTAGETIELDVQGGTAKYKILEVK
ncbi:MAG: transcription elongation factor GreA [Patescibacteria group bacterium]